MELLFLVPDDKYLDISNITQDLRVPHIFISGAYNVKIGLNQPQTCHF